MSNINCAELTKLLKEYPQPHVEEYVSYIYYLQTATNKKDGKLRNPWAQRIKEAHVADLFRRVDSRGLVFDGKHITLGINGISYDYVAYKNKMLVAYPESKIALNNVYEGDDFAFKEINGKVDYHHVHKDPFNKPDDKIVGSYFIVKNRRGEFLTALGKADIQKHRQIAKTDKIWADWFPEMCLKTVIKKGCKYHFDDIFREIEKDDNENYDLDLPLSVDLEVKQAIEAIDTIEGLKAYYNQNNPSGDTLTLLSKRKEEILADH